VPIAYIVVPYSGARIQLEFIRSQSPPRCCYNERGLMGRVQWNYVQNEFLTQYFYNVDMYFSVIVFL